MFTRIWFTNSDFTLISMVTFSMFTPISITNVGFTVIRECGWTSHVQLNPPSFDMHEISNDSTLVLLNILRRDRS
jgi:hypothetical protein